ncbi:glutamate receptor 3.7-like [Cucurbita moschata]|uniref:Glutamate receptor n=1 Tax=Cucurbita moschata TaxID=3662 RepID=A0A6J1FY42_CUCMO|nr:glutamate receptor 3.7-like [Cucurbita moschata]XP_022944514.1 glutamate receptor 3.7-like [Cucurbita moschata]XP_022944515.1 glutamate receptor 3.7-like [Cucurbita moschata]XP_022944516.1 glutamate receptor 3.7-like [Cucurbita moschata]
MESLLVLTLISSIWVFLAGSACCQRPAVVNIGAVFTFDSIIGRAAKVAMEAAVSDVNADPSILNGTRLNLIMADTHCNVLLGSIRAFQVLEKDVVAIVGPQSSVVAHMVLQIANHLQVPLISYAATDPTLSALQFPFFLRTTQSDAYQMTAMAELIDFYEWKEVIIIFVDDDYGRNGMSTLTDELDKKMFKVSYKLPLPSQLNLSEITDMLNKSKLLGPRVYVVHVNPDPRLSIFKIAHQLDMMTSDYVWLATDWLSSTLDSILPVHQTSLNILQGVVVLRQYTPESSQKTTLWSRLRKMLPEDSRNSSMNVHALSAYDTIQVVARAIDKFLNGGRSISFSLKNKFHDLNTSRMPWGKLKIFDDGALLLSILLQANFTGLSGRIEFNSDRNIVSRGYEVINIDRTGLRRVGYWSNGTGFTIQSPEALKQKRITYTHLNQTLGNVTWPGGKTERPRGWVIADNERPLIIGVPRRVSFIEFVTAVNGSHKNIQGYCIDLFNEARKLVPYDVPYRFIPFGNGYSNPSYDDLVKNIANGIFDAAVGDIAIVTNRTKVVDFSQPFASTGLVIVAPITNSKSNAWVFLKPFTVEMWCVTSASFFMIGAVIWLLEHRVNDDFRGPPKRQLVTVILFSFSTLFKTNQEVTISPLGRMVMVMWLFLLMVITSSYTASLTSILTVQQLSSPIKGLEDLITKEQPIGYQVGSFAFSYLTESLYLPRSRLVPLGSPEEYESALLKGPFKRGGVAAIIDELPYMELFLSGRNDFGMIGQPFTKSGWGFAFQRGSPLAVDISTAILKLSENGKLQKIHEKWFCKMGCPGERRRKPEPNQLHLVSFWGLYLLCGAFSLVCLFIFLFRIVRQFARYIRQQKESSHAELVSSNSNSNWTQVVYKFFDFVDEKEEAIKRLFSKA